VTIVAACKRAETGVGPSIASGNHMCKPNCDDFAIAPINKDKDNKSIILIEKIFRSIVTIKMSVIKN